MLAWTLALASIQLFQVCFVSISGLRPSQIEEIVSQHNTYRRMIAQRYNVSNMNKLVWSNDLQTRARQINICKPRSRDSNESRGRVGSNRLASVLSAWYEENRHFSTEINNCLPWNNCKKFRRMVNAKQVSVGCSLRSCGPWKHRHRVLSCLYEGGSEDSFNFLTGSVCTGCGESAPFCEQELCVPCNRATESCDCRKSCYRDGVGSGTLNSTTCVCTCQYGLGPNCDLVCKNPKLYEDYDYCSFVTENDCNDDDEALRETLREYCPEQCVCRPFPE